MFSLEFEFTLLSSAQVSIFKFFPTQQKLCLIHGLIVNYSLFKV